MGKRGKRREAATRKARDAFKATGLRQESTPPTAPTQTRRQILLRDARRKAIGIWSGIVTGVGLLGVFVLRPDVSIEPYATTDPTRPFEQQFFVQNTSSYPIHQVTPLCGLEDVKTPHSKARGLSITDIHEYVETLEAGAKTTLTCFWTTEQTQQSMEIIPWVEYKTPFGIPRCKAAKFKGKPAVGGTYIWTYDGSEECPTSN